MTGLPPDWLARKKHDLAVGDLDELLGVAEEVARRLGSPTGGEFSRWLRESVGSLRASNRQVLEALRDMGCPIATTNYDGTIEEVAGLKAVTWLDGASVERVLRRDDRGVIHLHGHWETPNSVVLGVRDYERALGDEHAQTMLKAVRTTRTLLFVGFGEGLSDPNFGAFLRWTRKVFPGSEYRHFRLALERDVQQLQSQHPPEERIFVIPYGSKHDDLAPFLTSLRPTGPTAPVTSSAPP